MSAMASARDSAKFKNSRKHEFECIVCPRVCFGAQEFRSHLLTHGFGKSYKCCECSQTFKSKESLRRHINKHEGKKPFLCDTCGKGFTTNQILKGHTATHHNEKPYSCSTCGRAFAHQSGLSRHLLLHSREQNHICHICGQLFLTSAYLTSHMLSHSGERNYTCRVCLHQFKHPSSLSRHYNQHHKELKGDKGESHSLFPTTHFHSTESRSEQAKKIHSDGIAEFVKKSNKKNHGTITEFQESSIGSEILEQFQISPNLEVSSSKVKEKLVKDALDFAQKCRTMPIPINIEVFKNITNEMKQISDKLAASCGNMTAVHFERHLTALKIIQSVVIDNILYLKESSRKV